MYKISKKEKDVKNEPVSREQSQPEPEEESERVKPTRRRAREIKRNMKNVYL